MKSFWGNCVSKPDSLNAKKDDFNVERIDDITYAFTLQTPFIEIINLKDLVSISIEGLEEIVDYKFSVFQPESENKMIVTFNFFRSFENKSIEIKLVQTKNSKLTQETTGNIESPDLIDQNLSIVSDLSSEYFIKKINLDNLELTKKEVFENSQKEMNVPWVFTYTLIICIIWIIVSIFSLLLLIAGNKLHFKSLYIKRIKKWLFIFLYQIIWICCLGHINRPLPNNMETFLFTIYNFSIGLDNLVPNISDHLPSQPQFYRLFKSNSFFKNSILILVIYFLVSIIFLNSTRKKSQEKFLINKLRNLILGNPIFILLFPTCLYPLINAILCFKNFNFYNSFALIDFVCSIMYFGFILSGKTN